MLLPEVVNLTELEEDKKERLLEELGYGVEGGFVLEEPGGDRRIDPYVEEPIPLDKMMILPGSTVVLKDTPLSLFSYLEDHGTPGEAQS